MTTKRQEPSYRRKRGYLREILAENVLNYRRAKRLSQEELAHICGLHRTYVGSIERLERNVTLNTLEILADALEVPVTKLLSKKKRTSS